MPAAPHVKLVLAQLTADTQARLRERLAALADPQVDVDLLQVGAHEMLLRPHLALHLAARTGRPLDAVLRQAGADRIELLTEAQAAALVEQRVPEDLVARVLPAVAPDWHLDCIRAPAAWAALGGADAIDWQDIVVGQIDTGYTRHAAFGFGAGGTPWLDTARSRSIEPAETGAEGYGIPAAGAGSGPGVDPMAFGAISKGHGTRIGSTISGRADLPGGQVFRGIAPRVPHVVVRITDTVAINTRLWELAQALDYLAQDLRVDAVNISLGAFPPVAHPAVDAALERAHRRGTVVVCAAGNHVDPVVYPARHPRVVAVAGVTVQRVPWSGSSFGPQVAFSAPAANVFRAQAQADGIGTGFAAGGDGTSYAAALTTGTAALWLARWRAEIATRYGRSARRVEAFRSAAQATAQRPPGWQPQPFGAGILDAGRLCTDPAAALPA